MNKFSEVMKKHTDEMLIDMINNHREEYTPEAIEAIEEELTRRGLKDSVILQKPIRQKNESDYDFAIREIIYLEKL